MPHPRTIIVTGANRGIGHAICQSLLSHPNLSNSPLKLFAASRKGASLDFKISNSSHQVFYPKLDVTSQDSIRDFNKEVEKSGIEGELVLVNNAGVNLDNEYGVENVRRTMDVNYYGTLHMCNTFLPHVKQSKGRIVNLASIASQLKFYSAAVQARFRDASSVPDHESIMKDFISSVESSSEDAAGFGPPARSYSVSKGLVRSLTAILAKENPDVIVNCCCPGWINTEMGNLVASKGRTAPKSGEEGARIPVRLAVGEDLGGVSGGYWANESVRGTGEGQVEEGWS